MEVGEKVWKNGQQFVETLLDILVPLRKTETLALVMCIKISSQLGGGSTRL